MRMRNTPRHLRDSCLGLAIGMMCMTAPARAQQAVVVGEIELAIGEVEGEGEYLFGRIGALARDGEGRIYVGDSGALEVRVFAPDGTYLFSVGRAGEGPGEFNTRICALVFDPDGRLWVNVGRALEVFEVEDRQARHIETLPASTYAIDCTRPMFAGPTGLTVPVVVFSRGLQHVRMYADGEVRERIWIEAFKGKSELGWPMIKWQHPTRGLQTMPIEPPFAVRSLVARAPDGSFAHATSDEYRVQLFNADGELQREIRRNVAGPHVTDAEANRERQRIETLQARVEREMGGAEFPEWEMPERKPPIYNMWYDEDGRLWVQTWPAEGDQCLSADVYDLHGGFLFTAEWPRRINISRGGVRGDAALGVQRIEFDVQRVVLLRFEPEVPEADARGR